MPLLMLLLPLLAQLPGAIGAYFKQKADLEAARIETDRQIELAKQTMAMELAKEQAEVAKTVLGSTSPHFKYFTFFMWFGPFMVGVVSPKTAHDIFVNLAGMPEWYVQSCMLIMFTVWGISVSAPVISNIFSGLGQFFESRREFKLEKARIDRAAYFNALRKIEGSLSQKEVDDANKLLDEVEK